MTIPPDNTAGVTTTSGLDDYEITGADGQYRAITTVLQDQEVRPYKVLFRDGSPGYETGRGRWNAGSQRLERTTIKTSTAGDGVKYSWPAGEKLVLIVADAELLGSLGGGGMSASTYDPNDIESDAFSMGNMVETSAAKVLTAVERSKLAGLETGATADQSGAEIKAAYEGESDTNAFTDAEKAKLGGVEAGATTDQTGAEIAAAYEGEADRNQYSDAEKAKLTGIEAGATADQTGAEIVSLYEAEANRNAYTDAEKTKLSGLESSKFLGTYTSLGALQSSHPAPVEGSYAHVDAGTGQDVSVYIWDNDDNAYQQQAAASSAETAASIKTKYESNADTNAFSDAEQSKLAGVEAGATADQSDSEIEAAYNNQVSIASQAEAEAGVATTVRRWTALRVRQAINALIGSTIQAYSSILEATTASYTTVDETKVDHLAVTQPVDLDQMERDISDSPFVFGLDRTDGGPVVIFAVGQSILYGNEPYRNGPYATDSRMHDYQYISGPTGDPTSFGFVSGPDLSAPLRADFFAGISVGIIGNETGDVMYGWAKHIIEKHDRDVYIVKLALGAADVGDMEATHWAAGAYVDETPGTLYNLMLAHFARAKTLLAGVTEAPVYPDYFLFTQGATNSLKIDPLTGAANPDYLEPVIWTERVLRLFKAWDNPDALDYISPTDTALVLLDLPPNRSWDYSGDHMKMLANRLGERAMLITQGERPIKDFIHPTGDGLIDIGRDIGRTISGELDPAAKTYGWRTSRNKTALAYTTYLREADGSGDVTQNLRWRYDSTNDLLILSPTEGSTIDWGWFDLRGEDHYKFEETADATRSVLFRVTARPQYDPEDIYQLRIPVAVVTTGANGWPRVGEDLTSSLVSENGDVEDYARVYAGDANAPLETDQQLLAHDLGFKGTDVLKEALRVIGDTSLVTVDPDGLMERSPVAKQSFGATIVGESALYSPVMGGIGAEESVIKRAWFNARIYGFRSDSGTTEVWEAEKSGIIYFDGTVDLFKPSPAQIMTGTQITHKDTGSSPQTLHVEGFLGTVVIRPTGIAGQTWKYRSQFEWEII